MKVALLGNLVGVSNEILIELRSRGIHADLFVGEFERSSSSDGFSDGTSVRREWVQALDPPPNSAALPLFARMAALGRKIAFQWKLVKRLRSYDILHSHSGSLASPRLAYLYFVVLRRKRYLAFATGSDIREAAALGNTPADRRVGAFFRRAHRVFLLNADMVALPFVRRLKRAEFFPFAINEERFQSPPSVERPPEYRGKLLCFMMSSLDFGVTDNWAGRNSMKHNDRFIRAFANFARLEPNAHAVILDRGTDRLVARRLIQDLNVQDRVTMLPPLSQEERRRWMAMADVVVDQFHIGCFGLGALEALSMGKCVLTYFNPDYTAGSYGDEIPILNARTEDEIHQSLTRARDAGFRLTLGKKARDWILKHHSRETVVDKLLAVYRETLENA